MHSLIDITDRHHRLFEQIFNLPAGFFSAQMHQDVFGRHADDDVIHDERARV